MNEIKTDTKVKMTDISITTILSEHNRAIAKTNTELTDTKNQLIQALEVIKDTQKNGIETDKMLFNFAQKTNRSLEITIMLAIAVIIMIFLNIILLMRLHG